MNSAATTAATTAATMMMINSASHHNSGPDHKCPKCGHEWDDEPEESTPMTPREKRILVFFIIISALLAIDAWGFKWRHINHLILEKQCNYQVPDAYKIVQKDNVYAIKLVKAGIGYEKYLTRSIFTGFGPKHVSIYGPKTFYNECKAKSYLKYYYSWAAKKTARKEKKKKWR